MRIVAVSGGFDPLHVGHIRYIREASKLGDELIVMLTRDDQLEAKKGFVFMPYIERKEILESIVGVNKVVQNIDESIEVYQTLEYYEPDIFAKGGDRTTGNMPKSEIDMCNNIGCEIIYGVGGGKIQASSGLVTVKW